MDKIGKYKLAHLSSLQIEASSLSSGAEIDWMQVGDWERKLQLSKDMVSRLSTNTPDTRERDASVQTSKHLDFKGRKVDLAQKQLMAELQQAILKRDNLLTKVSKFSSPLFHLRHVS